MTTQLDGQFDLSSANEDQALPGTTDVGSFHDADHTDTASASTTPRRRLTC